MTCGKTQCSALFSLEQLCTREFSAPPLEGSTEEALHSPWPQLCEEPEPALFIKDEFFCALSFPPLSGWWELQTLPPQQCLNLGSEKTWQQPQVSPADCPLVHQGLYADWAVSDPGLHR